MAKLDHLMTFKQGITFYTLLAPRENIFFLKIIRFNRFFSDTFEQKNVKNIFKI